MSELTALAPTSGERLDVVVSRAAGISRSQAARLVDDGSVLVNGVARPRSWRVERGDRVRIELPVEPSPPAAEDIAVRVVHEDDWIVVVSKPAGMVVHPAPGHPSGTLVNALLARAGRLPGERDRPGIVHRLDAGTSGLMIVAKREGALTELRRMMAAREVTRTYLALVEGRPHASATIDAPIGRSTRHRKKMAVVAEGREAITAYRRIELFRDTALLEVKPRTGRTHQIRVHLAASGHAVVGDRVYGRDRRLAGELGLERPFLHAAELAFIHPVTGEAMHLVEPLPDELQAVRERLRATTQARS